MGRVDALVDRLMLVDVGWLVEAAEFGRGRLRKREESETEWVREGRLVEVGCGRLKLVEGVEVVEFCRGWLRK